MKTGDGAKSSPPSLHAVLGKTEVPDEKHGPANNYIWPTGSYEA